MNLVERLRYFSLARSGELRPNADAVLADEAADRIERLEAALQNIIERYKTAEDGWPAEDMRALAEAALAGKEG